MRKFWKIFLLVSLSAIAISLICMAIALNRLADRFDFTLPDDVRVLVVGNSMGENSINDAMLPGWKNACLTAELLPFTNVVLENALAHNPQIDTVIVTLGYPSLLNFDDQYVNDLNIQDLRWIDDRIAISPWQSYRDYYLRIPSFMPFLLTSAPHAMWRRPQYGSYFPRTEALEKDDAWWQRLVARRGGSAYTKEMIESGSKVQVSALQKVLDTCRRYGVTAVIYNSPLQQMDRHIDSSGYYDFLHSLGEDVLVADYTLFELPDSTYFSDLIHLNYRGADYFTSHLREHGLSLTKATEAKASNGQ